MQSNDDDMPNVREILGELALERVFNAKQVRAMNDGKLRTSVLLVPGASWVDPIATAVEGLVENLAIYRRKDGKRVDDDGDFAKLTRLGPIRRSDLSRSGGTDRNLYRATEASRQSWQTLR